MPLTKEKYYQITERWVPIPAYLYRFSFISSRHKRRYYYTCNNVGVSEQLAQKIGKTQEWISRHLAMLQLQQVNIMPRGIMEQMTERQAREVLAAPPVKREEILKQIAETGVVPSSRGDPFACGDSTTGP